MPRKPDFFSQLNRDELEKLEAFAREPGRTVDQVHDWLLAQGFTASRSAVGRWKKGFDEEDGLSAAADLADTIFTKHADVGFIDLNKSLALMLQQRLANALATIGPVPKNLKKMATIGTLVERLARISRHTTKNQIEDIDLKEREREFQAALDRLSKKAATAGGITQADIDETSFAMFGVKR